MKVFSLSLLLGICGLAAVRAADTFAPESFSAERYQHIWEKRPFSPATPTITAPPEDGIEQRYALCGLIKMADQWVAFVLNRKTLERQRVSATANESGLQLETVQEAANSRESTIVLRANGQTGVVRFDPSLMNAAPGKEVAANTGKSSAKENSGSPGAVEQAPTLASTTSITKTTARPAPPSAARTLRRNPVNLSQ